MGQETIVTALSAELTELEAEISRLRVAREREKVLPEVEATVRSWKPSKVVPLRLGEPL
jgi:hypothetical protein